MPEEWPWEEAKKIFQKPDVTPADEVEVRSLLPRWPTLVKELSSD